MVRRMQAGPTSVPRRRLERRSTALYWASSTLNNVHGYSVDESWVLLCYRGGEAMGAEMDVQMDAY